MRAEISIFRATIQSTRASLYRALGGRWPLIGVLVLGLALSLGMNIIVFRTLHQMAGALTAQTSPLPQGQREALLSNMLSSVMLLGAVIALVLGALIPNRSNVLLVARVGGASRFSLGVSETLAQYLVAAIALVATQTGLVIFVSLASPAPLITGIAIGFAALTFAALALALKSGLRLVMRWVGLGDEMSNLASLLVSMSLVLMVLGDLMITAFDGMSSPIRSVLEALWFGETIPTSLSSVASSFLTFVVALFCSILLGAWGSNRVAFTQAKALCPSGRSRNPRRVWAFGRRELLLAVRQPVSQISAVCLLLLMSGMAVAVRVGWIPIGPSSYLFAFLCALGGELAYGRTHAFHWIYRSAGYSVRTVVVVKFGAILIVQALILTVSLVAAAPFAALAPILPRTLLLFLSLSAITFLCGVLVPISEAAPYGMIGTSVLVLALDIALVFVDSAIGEAHVLAVVVNVCLAAAAVWAATSIATVKASRLSA